MLAAWLLILSLLSSVMAGDLSDGTLAPSSLAEIELDDTLIRELLSPVLKDTSGDYLELLTSLDTITTTTPFETTNTADISNVADIASTLAVPASARLSRPLEPKRSFTNTPAYYYVPIMSWPVDLGITNATANWFPNSVTNPVPTLNVSDSQGLPGAFFSSRAIYGLGFHQKGSEIMGLTAHMGLVSSTKNVCIMDNLANTRMTPYGWRVNSLSAELTLGISGKTDLFVLTSGNVPLSAAVLRIVKRFLVPIDATVSTDGASVFASVQPGDILVIAVTSVIQGLMRVHRSTTISDLAQTLFKHNPKQSGFSLVAYIDDPVIAKPPSTLPNIDSQE